MYMSHFRKCLISAIPCDIYNVESTTVQKNYVFRVYKRSSINYVTVLGRGHGFCDDSTEVLVLKSVTIGVGRPESKVDKIA